MGDAALTGLDHFASQVQLSQTKKTFTVLAELGVSKKRWFSAVVRGKDPSQPYTNGTILG